MSEKITMPKLGLTMTEGTVSEWKVSPGEKVKKGDIILTVATDKLTYEVEAPRDGVILDIVVKAGETVPVGSVLAFIGDEGEQPPSPQGKIETKEPKMQAPAPGETPAVEKEKKEEILSGPVSDKVSPLAKKWAAVFGIDPAKLSGSGQKGRVVKDDVMKAAARFRATPLARRLAREGGAEIEEIPGSGPGGRTVAADVKAYLERAKNRKTKASPVAMKMADEMGIDLESIPAVGRIMKEDVIAAAGGAGLKEHPAAEETPRQETEQKRLPLTRMRKIIAERMSYSASTIPSVFFNIETDFSEFMKIRGILNESLARKGVRLSFNDIMMKICARVLEEMPMANASYDAEAGEYILHDDVNIGLAVSVDGGLLVPNVKSVQKKTLEEISLESAELVEKARKGALLPEDMEGGTFTITNLGMFGIHDFIPIINPPEACILAVNAVVDKPVVRDGEVVIRPMSMIGLSADHRILDGADAARFLARIRELVENPCMLLL